MYAWESKKERDKEGFSEKMKALQLDRVFDHLSTQGRRLKRERGRERGV